TAGDVAVLDEWVRRGGVVVLGYDGDGEGYLDRWTANRWLAYEGAGISIGDRVLEDTTTRVLTTGRAQPWAVARPVGDEPLGSAYDPFPLDRNHVVVTREPTQLLALTRHRAFVRASRSPAPRPDAATAAHPTGRRGDDRAAARCGQEIRASRECPRLAAPAGPARLVDAALGDTGGAARPPAARHARLARHVPRRGRLQLALRRRLSGGGRLAACPLVGARRCPARLERCRKPARAPERRLDPGVG